MNKPGQTAYEAYYRAIGGWARDHHWAMISSDERRAWRAVEDACKADQPAPTQGAPACDNPECDEACQELHPTTNEVVK